MRVLYLFLACVLGCYGDSILDITESKPIIESSPPFNLQSNLSAQSTPHPILQGLNKVFSNLHNDNFISLESPKNTESSPDSKLDSIKTNTPPSNNANNTKPPHKPKNPSNKPKVLIIMDDLSTLEQIKNLEKLPLNITPSLFPRTAYSPHTPKLAQRLSQQHKSFMIHLPLEAQNFAQKGLEPIKSGADTQSIKQILIAIKQDFPSLMYLNNHTGSKFTQNKQDMRHLLSVLDELGLKFIDSVTTSHPASEALALEQNRLIMSRDIFLDNTSDVAYTKAQIKSLIKKAQKKGYAIAICHPHASTFKALEQSSDEINANLELLSPSDLESYLLQNATSRYIRTRFEP